LFQRFEYCHLHPIPVRYCKNAKKFRLFSETRKSIDKAMIYRFWLKINDRVFQFSGTRIL